MKQKIYQLLFYALIAGCGTEKTSQYEPNKKMEELPPPKKEPLKGSTQDAQPKPVVAKEEPKKEEPKIIKITENLTCESIEMQEKICPVTSGKLVSVSIKKQLSGSPCTKDTSWFFKEDQVRVTTGCRAEFSLEIEKLSCETDTTCNTQPTTPGSGKEGVVSVSDKGQPTINGLESKFSCTQGEHADCTNFCTVLVDGVEAGRYIGDTNGSDFDLPTFRFTKRGDQYCGGAGGTCTVQIACRNKKHNMFITFKNPGAPASGPADPGSPHRFNTEGWVSSGLSYGFLWKSAGNDGKLAILLGGHLQKDNE